MLKFIAKASELLLLTRLEIITPPQHSFCRCYNNNNNNIIIIIIIKVIKDEGKTTNKDIKEDKTLNKKVLDIPMEGWDTAAERDKTSKKLPKLMLIYKSSRQTSLIKSLPM
uniref:Uncharacterized protein n=1 Tax=Cacopsylla melanoneura TaxID=428564 RepID=A0A8D8U9Z4_9HEMI